MSSTKEFRIQNGVDITGDVVVGGQIVIQSDGTILLPSSDTLASMITQATSNQVDALQLQIDTILGSSPEHLNTLQEIVALFQSADGDLGTLINQNSTAISSFQTELDLKATPSDLTALTTTVDAFKASVSGVPSTTTTTTTITVPAETTTVSTTISWSDILYTKEIPVVGAPNLWAIDTTTGNPLFNIPAIGGSSANFAKSFADNDSYIALSMGPHTNRQVAVFQKLENGLGVVPTPLHILSASTGSLNGSSGWPAGSPSADTFFGVSKNSGSDSGAIVFAGGHLFVGEYKWGFTGLVKPGRINVYDISQNFQLVRHYELPMPTTGATDYSQAQLGQVLTKSGNFARFPWEVDGGASGVDWLDGNDVNSLGRLATHKFLDSFGYGPRSMSSDNYSAYTYFQGESFDAYPPHNTILVSGSSTSYLPVTGRDVNTGIRSMSDSHMAFLVDGVNSSDVDIYSIPDSNGQSQISYVGTISKLSSQSLFTDVAVSGSNVSVFCVDDDCVYVYDVTSSLTTPIKTILHPSPETSDGNDNWPSLWAEYSSATGTTIVPETTTVTNTVTVPEKSVIYATSVNESAPDTFDGTRPLYAIDALTGNTLYTMTHPSNLQGSLGEYRTENDSYIIISSVNRNPVNVHGGEVYVYTKNSDGLPEGTPLTITSPAPASINPDELFGCALLLSGDYLFVGEKQYTTEAPSYQPFDTDQSNPIFTHAGRVSVYQVSTGFQFVKSYNMSDGTGDTSGGAYLLGQHIVGSGNYVMFNIPYHEELPYPQHGINTGQIWVVDTNNINDPHTILGGSQGTVTSNDTHFFITTGGTVSVYESNTLSLVSQIQPPNFSNVMSDRNSVNNNYFAAMVGQDSVYVYNVPDLSLLGVVTKPVNGEEFENVAVAGSTLAVSSYRDEYIKLYDIPTSLTTPTHTVNAPQSARYFGYYLSGYTVDGSQSTTTETTTINTTTTTIVPIETLETTTTNVVGAINDLHAGISSLSGGTCIDYNASTGVISVDEADAAANLHVATSGDATTLEGQTVSHYRQDVYDIHGNIIN